LRVKLGYRDLASFIEVGGKGHQGGLVPVLTGSRYFLYFPCVPLRGAEGDRGDRHLYWLLYEEYTVVIRS